MILEEVKRDVLFDGRDPRSVGNGTAVSSPLAGAIVSPGSKWPFPSVLPKGLAPTSGTRRTPPPPTTRSNAEWHSALQTKSRDEKWDQRDRLSQLTVEDSGGLARSSGGRGSGGPDGQRRCYSCHHLIRLILFHPSFEGGGVSGNTWRRHPSRFFPYGNWDRAGPEDETEGCPRSQSAIRHERGHPK